MHESHGETSGTWPNFSALELTGQHGDFDLVDVVHFARLDCHDVRDRIFGLQGLVKEEQRIVTNYALSAEELALQVLEFLLNRPRKWTAEELKATLHLLRIS